MADAEIMNLIKDKIIITKAISEMIYGTIEIRKKSEKKYIYVHYRDEGILETKYVGEYTDELYNLILINNNKVKDAKQRIKNIDKRLKELNYTEKELFPKVSENIDFAKRNLVDTIYKQAVLEGVTTTFAETESIIEGGKVTDMTPNDILKIINLKHAWEFILAKNVILSKDDYSLLCQINKLVLEGFYYNAGKPRTTPVVIGGTSWEPDYPLESTIKEDLEIIFNSKETEIDKAIDLLLYIMRKQIFIDGNKRTSVIFVNHYLIASSQGLIVIPDSKAEIFKNMLIEYYESEDKTKITKFLKDECHLRLTK